MNKTKVDDILVEMISPKLKVIEEKFSSGKGLTNEDVITLLLKSQFNHINHLDQKLNDVSNDVASLKLAFAQLETKFSQLETTFEKQKIDIQKTITRTMYVFMGVLTLIITVFKLMDYLSLHQ